MKLLSAVRRQILLQLKFKNIENLAMIVTMIKWFDEDIIIIDPLNDIIKRYHDTILF